MSTAESDLEPNPSYTQCWFDSPNRGDDDVDGYLEWLKEKNYHEIFICNSSITHKGLFKVLLYLKENNVAKLNISYNDRLTKADIVWLLLQVKHTKSLKSFVFSFPSNLDKEETIELYTTTISCLLEHKQLRVLQILNLDISTTSAYFLAARLAHIPMLDRGELLDKEGNMLCPITFTSAIQQIIDELDECKNEQDFYDYLTSSKFIFPNAKAKHPNYPVNIEALEALRGYFSDSEDGGALFFKCIYDAILKKLSQCAKSKELKVNLKNIECASIATALAKFYTQTAPLHELSKPLIDSLQKAPLDAQDKQWWNQQLVKAKQPVLSNTPYDQAVSSLVVQITPALARHLKRKNTEETEDDGAPQPTKRARHI